MVFNNFTCTGLRKFLCTWFGEVCSSCWLSLLPQLACNTLATTYKEIFTALETINKLSEFDSDKVVGIVWLTSYIDGPLHERTRCNAVVSLAPPRVYCVNKRRNIGRKADDKSGRPASHEEERFFMRSRVVSAVVVYQKAKDRRPCVRDLVILCSRIYKRAI